MQFDQPERKYVPKPTDDELTAHVLSKVDEAPHVLIGYTHLTPNRTRVMATLIGSGKYDDMALEVLLNDIDTIAKMKADEEATKRGV